MISCYAGLMKRGIWVLGWCASFAALACGGQAITISDSGGAGSTNPASGGTAGHGGASNYPSAGSSAIPYPTSGGTTSAYPNSGGSTSSGVAGSPAQAGIGNVGATGNLPGMPDPGSATCPDFTPCGGDLVGDWRFTNVCTSPALEVGDSPYCAADQVTANIGGTLSFFGDGRVVPVTTYTNHHVVPPSCLPALGGCGNPGGALSGCASAPDGSCICDSAQPTGSVDGESFVNAGSYFLLTESPGTPPISVYYCQSGNQLTMRASDQGRIFVYQLTRP